MKRRKDGRYLKVITLNSEKLYFYSTESTERKAERDIQRQILEYTEKKEKGKLFSEVADEWEEYHYPKVEYTTSYRYRSLLNHARKEFEGFYIKEIQAIDIDRFLNYFVYKGYASKTIKDELSVVKMIFKYAYIHKYIDTDPTQYISPPKGKPAVHRKALENNEIDIIKNNINIQFGLFPYFVVYTGLRKSEALALQFKDIDREKKEITISKSLYYKGNKPYFKTPKTENGIRTVVLPDALLPYLPKGKPNEYVFSVNGSQPLLKSQYDDIFEKYRNESGLDATSYQFRHTYATLLFEADINEKDTQTLMGHADIATTRNIYTHIRKNRMQETAKKFNNYIKIVNS